MLTPLSDIVVIRRLAPQQVSDGGIHLVYDPDYREDIGEVAYVGPGKKQPVSVKPGDKVLFSTNGHQITVINGEELVVLREPSIIGVFVE